jgi:hypothetical protein
MSDRPNVAVVRQIYACFKNRDLKGLMGLFSPDIELMQSDEVPWGGIHNGHDGARESFGKLVDTINSTLVIDRFIDAGDHVAAIGRTQGTVNATGARYDVPIAHVWELDQGKVVSVQFFIDNPTMMAALAKK